VSPIRLKAPEAHQKIGEHVKLRRLSLAKSPYHHYLVEDENFRRWVEALERGSITTASNYFRKSVSFERSPASFSKPQSGLGIHTSHSAALCLRLGRLSSILMTTTSALMRPSRTWSQA